MNTVVFLSGTSRGASLEGLGRSVGAGFRALGMEFLEVSLMDDARFREQLGSLNFHDVRLVFSFVSMGMEISMRGADGQNRNLWQGLGVPFISIHGDSPAYFFDRHVVKGPSFVSMYSFQEHCVLRKRLPHIYGMLETYWPPLVDPISKQEIDFKTKKTGELIFLKNGKDPAKLRQSWQGCLEPRVLRALLDIASELENHLDDPGGNQIDDLVTRYFRENDLDIESLTKLRLFFIAQLDDYLRAVKGTRMVEALLDLPVQIRGNDWGHVDFTGKKATYIDECDYVKTIGLIRNALGVIDMSPNTSSRPHDRVMRAWGSHTLCLTNEQEFLNGLPYQDQISFRFGKECLQERVAKVLNNRDTAIEMGVEIAEAYRKAHPPEQMILKMLDCASLVRLNNLNQRPDGLQDFFVWPPHRLS